MGWGLWSGDGKKTCVVMGAAMINKGAFIGEELYEGGLNKKNGIVEGEEL